MVIDSLKLLEWDKLCDSVSSFASTSLAKQALKVLFIPHLLMWTYVSLIEIHNDVSYTEKTGLRLKVTAEPPLHKL